MNQTSTAAIQQSNLSPTTYMGGAKTRSRSPTPQRKFLSQLSQSNLPIDAGTAASTVAATGVEKPTAATLLPSPNLARRSMSPSPRRLIDMRKKQNSLDSSSSTSCNASGPKSLPIAGNNDAAVNGTHVQFESLSLVDGVVTNTTGMPPTGSDAINTSSSKFENISDNGSEISDEGYRSLGVIQSNAQKRESLHSQTSMDDAENNGKLKKYEG